MPPEDAVPRDAIELLAADHDVLRTLAGKLSSAAAGDGGVREELLARIDRALQIHSMIEEEIFYPAVKAAGGSEEARMFYEAIEEHRAIEKLVLPDLRKITPSSDRFSGRAKVLQHLVEHHADEEEREMFAAARQLFSDQQLAELGARMERRKRALGG